MAIITILLIIPMIIWANIAPFGSRFSDLVSTTTSIGQILGLLGMTLYSINLILAGRLKILDKYFKGLDKVYSHHRIIGTLSFSMLLFHPLFLVVKYVTFSLQEAAMFFVPFVSSMSVTWGILSLGLMIVLLAITFYSKIKYNIWKFSHKFMIIAFFLAVIHTFLISSDISRNNFLRYYIFTLSILGLIISVRRAYFSKILINKFKYIVKEVKDLGSGIVSIDMTPVYKKFNFIPGQFIFVSFKDPNVGSESHPFSIASNEKENNFRLVIKNFGDFTSRLKYLQIGSNVLVEGPYGNFTYKSIENKKQVWIAGGIGITPFMSMAYSLDESYLVDLYVCVKEKGEAVLLNELLTITQKNKNFHVMLWCSNDQGFISAKFIADKVGGISDKDIFMCGPAVFMESLNQQFLSLNVVKDKIHYENFNFFS